jgi:serine/threonine protein kinase
MTPESWAKIKEIFADALERPVEDRAAFVRNAAGGDEDTIREVHRLMAESERDTGMLGRPIVAFPRPAAEESGPRYPVGAVLARRFRIIRFIAHGGMGEVYEAEDLQLRERVALKAIRQGAGSSGELLELLKKEVQLARRVTHPNVCRVYDLVPQDESADGDPAMLLSMELLEGRTLADQLRSHGPFQWRDALPLIEQIGAGIQAAHDAGIVHGDLKPANVMLAAGPAQSGMRAIVMDFGVALPAAHTGENVRRGGTPGYLAPEQAEGQPVSTAADLYSFGVIIAETLGASRSPKIQADPARMPSAWIRILERSLDPDPDRRYARAADMVHALRASTQPRWEGRKRIAFGLLAAASAIALVRHPWTAGNPVLRQLFTETGSGGYAWSASPDGRYIAETRWDTGDLALRDVASGRLKRLTRSNGTTGAWGAVFSPDSKRLVYRWNLSRTESELHIIGVDGKGERLLYKEPGLRYLLPLDWSPDGKSILALMGRSFMLLSAADGTSKPVQGVRLARAARAMFTPDGSGFVFDAAQVDSKESLFDIYRGSASGGEEPLVQHPANDSLIGWSPDGRRLVFSSDRGGSYGIWAVNVSARGTEGEPQELRPATGAIEPLGISRDGSLFYRLDAPTVNVYTAVLDLAGAKTVSLPKPVVTRYNGPYEYPNWSADGARLVFDSRRDLRLPELLIHTRADDATRVLPVDLSHVWRAQWYAHDSAVVALGMSKDGKDAFYRIDPNTGTHRLLAEFNEVESNFEGVWSADGDTMFNRYSDWRRGLFRLDIATGERRSLYVPPAGEDLATENLALSPDGRMLAFHARNDAAGTASLMILPANGGAARPLLTIRRPEAFLIGSFTWTPDSKEILASRTRNEVSEIWRVPVDGSPPAKIDFPAMRVQSLRLNRDGKTIAFTNVKNRAEIWVFERFLK